MSFTIDAHCDNCSSHIADYEEVYCEACYNSGAWDDSLPKEIKDSIKILMEKKGYDEEALLRLAWNLLFDLREKEEALFKALYVEVVKEIIAENAESSPKEGV